MLPRWELNPREHTLLEHVRYQWTIAPLIVTCVTIYSIFIFNLRLRISRTGLSWYHMTNTLLIVKSFYFCRPFGKFHDGNRTHNLTVLRHEHYHSTTESLIAYDLTSYYILILLR